METSRRSQRAFPNHHQDICPEPLLTWRAPAPKNQTLSKVRNQRWMTSLIIQEIIMVISTGATELLDHSQKHPYKDSLKEQRRS